jgi:nucleoid-associated protein YgaU
MAGGVVGDPSVHGSTDTEMGSSEMNSRKLKLVSAAAGASAVVAMGALTAVLSDDSSSTTVVSDPEITLGETTTIEKAASTPETTIAVPEVTAEVPDGFGP